MKKLLLLPAILICFYSTAQINSNFNQSEKIKLAYLTDFDLKDYQFFNYAEELRPNLQVFPMAFNFNDANEQIWMGKSYSSDIKWYNLKINTTHHYDINGVLRRSIWSVKLK